MSQPFPRAGFGDVDRAADPQALVQSLDAQHEQAFKRMYKPHTFALLDLRPGHTVLDAGCGTGLDTQAMAGLVAPTGSVTGTDFSQTMVEEARRRAQGAGLPVTFAQGDLAALPFATQSFDRCRADRTFQHLPDPMRALAELVRVTRPGGKILIVEPDHEMLVIDSPYKDVTRRFLAFRSDTLAQGAIAHHLYAMFREQGLHDIIIEPLTHVSTNFAEINQVMHFDGGIRIAQQHGAVSEAEADAWLAALSEAVREERFFFALTYFIVIGTKPSSERSELDVRQGGASG